MDSRRGRTVRWVVVVVAVILGGIVGYRLGVTDQGSGVREEAAGMTEPAQEEGQIWYCSMHPEVRSERPGKCPKCGMDLVPLPKEAGSQVGLGARQLRLSAAARQLASVETAAAERRRVEAEVEMVGEVLVDETRVSHVAARVAGRLDRLYVDYTGMAVRKGDHLADLYSPELVSAQRELLAALQAMKETGEGAILAGTAQSTVEAARQRLRLWGVSEEQVAAIEARGEVATHMTIYAPRSGIVVERGVQEGDYVREGTRLMTVADLGRVWAVLEAYESDVQWVRYGQKVEFETQSWPGERFEGMVAFVDPLLDSRTRTVRVRVNVENAGGRLKPGMFVRGRVRAEVTAGGGVRRPMLAGEWMCPMHPEVVSQEPGRCTICEMPLVRAETLGYVGEETAEEPLVIPATAPLITGKRAVVYVAVAGEEGVYEGREVVLGPRAGDWYVVEEGLKEGELVVVKGAFKIDATMQIRAKKSMMSPEGEDSPRRHEGHEEKEGKKNPESVMD